MIHDLKPYPAYKDSGVPWLGEVPEHWEVKRLKHIYQRIVGGSTPSSSEASYWEGNIIWITPVDVSRSTRLSTSLRKITQEGLASCSSELVPAGSIVVTSRAPVGNTAIAMVDLCTNQGCKALIQDEKVIQSAYGFATLRILQTELQSLASGTTFTEISTSKLGTVPLPLPPFSEQSTIVHYLDYIESHILRYIRTKQKLIKLLEEQKQAIIHQAITRGLDPNVRLKPSGVEWLGDVPEHWEVRRNGRLFAQRNQTGFSELPILEVSLNTGVRVRDFENTTRKQVMSDREKYKLAVEGDIAYNMMRMWQGAVGVAPVDGLVSPAYVVARPLDDVDPLYFSNLFRTSAYMNEVNSCSRGIVKDRNRLYWEDFKQIYSPYPPLEEQTQIADAIEEKTHAINHSIEQVRYEISLLREYRTRLIADVVTGKLDVREVAANLSKKSEATDIIDIEELDEINILEEADEDNIQEEMEV